MNIIKKILDYGVILFIIFWLFTIVVDFSNLKKEKEPFFCLRNKTHNYEDGIVEECLGLGYKVFTYKRDSINNLMEMTPSWRLPKEKIN